ncbi:Predicted nucleic acid-binding protein, contains PIN domain [Porphyromonadaceae bacterium KH3CP3RA]|nr:Predicted nucleic acid-binding protein, contains PIN domain [Porphyromonadaceae bacterium KH3CP3RA]
MFETVISDTSCLIVLSKIGQLDLLNKIFGHIVTTSEIAEEFGENLPDWIGVVDPEDSHKKRLLEIHIDKGEASAVALALESENPLLIVDDFKARKMARMLNIGYTGTIGIIILAKNKGIIDSIKPVLEKIKETNFRISPELELQALLLAKE